MQTENNRDCKHGQLARSCEICDLENDNLRLRGIIARNAMQRLKGEDTAEMFVTAQDIKDSLEVLYEWQRTMNPPNDHKLSHSRETGAGSQPKETNAPNE